MSQLASTKFGPTEGSFEHVGTGQNVYETSEVVEGRVKWLEAPEDVISFVQEEDVSDVIVIARGGTTTFLTMALNAGIRGVITLQGAPESHLGIVAREYGIPCIMSVAFEKGVRTGRGETIPADGVRVRMDVSQRSVGTVSVEPGAPVDDSPVENAVPAMSEEQMAQIMVLLEKFGGEIPHGSEGDKVMQAEMKTRVLFLEDESLQRSLTTDETNELIRYLTWNEWDALAARATEGESGLIPRQEYEAMGIMNCWFKHPEWMAAIQQRVGVDGLITIGETAQHEIGTKINMLHLWALCTAPSFGRGIALELNLHDLEYKSERIVDSVSTVRSLYKGLWGGGEMFASMRDYKAPVLERSWVDRFTADRISIEDDAARSTFQRFSAAAEMMGFLLHFDNRLGLSDTGPYPTDDGGFVLVRDLFINEPAFPWSEVTDGLPYAVTIAMFFRDDDDLTIKFTDLSTAFSDPANYLPFVDGVAVYAREKFDTPMDELRTLSLEDMTALRASLETQATSLYTHIAGMSQRDKILAGAMVYTAGFVLPVARAAGMYDELVEDYGLLEIHPAVDACYDTIIGGLATEMIPRLFLTGSWGNPVPQTAGSVLADDADEFPVLHALRVRGFASPEGIAESTGLDVARIEQVVAGSVERGHVKQRTGRITGAMLTPSGKARHVLLRSDVVSRAMHATISDVYESFLTPNRSFKQLTTDWQMRGESGASEADLDRRLGDVHQQVSAVVAAASVADPRFATYQPRFESALAAFHGGDLDALAKPLSGSYHDVWMELHEDLLAMLGRGRTEADE